MTKEEFLKQIKNQFLNPIGLESLLKSDEAKFLLSDRDTFWLHLPSQLRFLSSLQELKADKEVVMAAVSLNGFALTSASDDLKADKRGSHGGGIQ